MANRIARATRSTMGAPTGFAIPPPFEEFGAIALWYKMSRSSVPSGKGGVGTHAWLWWPRAACGRRWRPPPPRVEVVRELRPVTSHASCLERALSKRQYTEDSPCLGRAEWYFVDERGTSPCIRNCFSSAWSARCSPATETVPDTRRLHHNWSGIPEYSLSSGGVIG